MAWTYSDWRSQPTVAAKIERLTLHLQEVADAQSGKSGVSAHGYSVSYEGLGPGSYYGTLERELRQLEAASAATAKVRFRG